MAEHGAGLHREEGAVQSAELFHGHFLVRAATSLASVASQSRMWLAVHTGASSRGTWPTSGATAKRQEGLAAATARAAPIDTSRSFSPCNNSTGRRIAFPVALNALRRASTAKSERAAVRKCSSMSG